MYSFASLTTPRSAVDNASDSRARGPGFDTRSGHILSFHHPLIQDWQLSVTGERYVHEVLVNRLGGLSLPRLSVVRLTDRPDMTLAVYRGCKTTTQHSLTRRTPPPTFSDTAITYRNPALYASSEHTGGTFPDLSD